MCKLLRSAWFYFRIVVNKIIDFAFSLYWDGKRRPVPALEGKHAFLKESAVELARRIKQKELKSEHLVQALIERIKQVNPIINAIAEDNFEGALEAARLVDRSVAQGLSEEDARKPFLGVPFTTKESQAIKGFRYTMGLWERRECRADEDSDAVILLREAGAILLASTNLPELLMWQETRNNVYGQTNNPHHSGRSPGGSSGAEAALTASCATTISLCSDIGGSTRMPAFFCGMFGHHPTANVTSSKGVFFRKESPADSMFNLGIISRHAVDLAPLTKVIAGNKAHLLQLDRQVDIQNIKFYYTESGGDLLVSPFNREMKDAMKRVVTTISQNLTSTSNGPQPYEHDGFNHMYRLWQYWISKEPENYAHIYNNMKGEASAVAELFKKMFCMSRHCLAAVIYLAEQQLLPKVKASWAEQLTQELKDDLISKLGDNGVLLFPSAPRPAPYHYSFFLRPYDFAYFAIVNALKFPSTQVPIGKTVDGLPLGIQVVAAPYNDALCIAVAKHLETLFGGAVMP